MMMHRLRQLWADRRGVSAVEFSLILPAFALLAVYGFDGWLMIQQELDMRTAVQSAARYYEIGGSSDTDAQTLALAAWAHKPASGAMSIVRACACGGVTISCTSSCNGTATTTVTISASSSYSGSVSHKTLNESQVVRVR